MKRAIFITGTDTGIGKTLISGLLARYLLKKGRSVITQKWIQTGSPRGMPSDIKTHLEIMGKSKDYIRGCLGDVCPYVFSFPASPHLASELEHKKIIENKIIKSFESLSDKFDWVIVEGTGGVLVPFNRKNLVIDIVKRLNLDILLVAGNKLGAINHTLMSLESLRKRELNILGIILNNLIKDNRIILEDNYRIIKGLTGERIFGVLPWGKARSQLYKKFDKFALRIIEKARHG